MKKLICLFLSCCFLFSAPTAAFAHSGGTDAYGGHHDYKNVSGLGPYHYHHGYGPHLHPNGICPYDSSAPSRPSSSASSGSSSNSSSRPSPSASSGSSSSASSAPTTSPAPVKNPNEVTALTGQTKVTVNGAALSAPILTYLDQAYVPLQAFVALLPSAQAAYQSDTKTTAVTVSAPPFSSQQPPEVPAETQRKADLVDDQIVFLCTSMPNIYHDYSCTIVKNNPESTIYAMDRKLLAGSSYIPCPSCYGWL